MGQTSFPPDALIVSGLATSEPVAAGVWWLNNGALTYSQGIPPAISSQPAAATVNEGETAAFSVTATNATSYQWQKQESGAGDWADISGATSASYTTAALTSADDNGDVYRVVVTGEGGDTTSSTAALTVIALPGNALAQWKAADYVAANNAIPNAATATAMSTRINKFPRRNFSGIFFTRSLVTATDNAVVGPDTKQEASSLVCASGAWYMSMKDLNHAPGTYTVAAWIRSSDSNDYDIRFNFNGTRAFTATPTWQRITFTETFSSNLTVCFLQNVSNAAANLDIVDWEIFPGSADNQTGTEVGHLFLSTNTPVSGGEMDFTSTGRYGVTSFSSDVATGGELTIAGLVSKTDPSSGFIGLLSKLTSYTDFTAGVEISDQMSSYWKGNKSLQHGYTTDSASDLEDTGYHVVTITIDGTNVNSWIDGSLWRTQNTVSGSVPAIRDFFMASIISTLNYGGGAKFKEVNVWERKLTDTEVVNATLAMFDSTSTTKPTTNLLVAEGDSLTTGDSHWQTYIENNVTAGRHVISGNWAGGGNTIPLNLNARLPDLLRMAVPSGMSNRMIVSLLMTNGLTDPTTFLSEMETYVTALKNVGAKVAVGTLPPRTSATHNTHRAAVNPTIRNWVGENKIDAVIDYAADPVMGPDAAASDTSLYYDGTHPTAAGQDNLEAIYRPVINGLLI